MSRVRVIADPAGSSLFPGGGLPVGADFGWIPRGSRCSAERECTFSTDTYGFTVVVMAAVDFVPTLPRCRRSSHLRLRRLACHWGGQFCEYPGQYGSCWGVLFYPVVESQLLRLRVDPPWTSLHG